MFVLITFLIFYRFFKRNKITYTYYPEQDYLKVKADKTYLDPKANQFDKIKMDQKVNQFKEIRSAVDIGNRLINYYLT